jgi:hypothetical protein
LGRVSTLTVLLTGALGAVCAGFIIAAQERPSSLNWPLLAVPLVVLPAAFAGSKAIRGTGAAVMCGWCCLAAASLGLFFGPCAVAMIAAAREAR